MVSEREAVGGEDGRSSFLGWAAVFVRFGENRAVEIPQAGKRGLLACSVRPVLPLSGTPLIRMRFGLPALGAARAAPLAMLAPGLPLLPELLLAPELTSQLTSLLADSAISSTADDLTGALFGASLFPWLAMLYWLKHPTVAAPPGVAFGLTFLLAFVFGTIPAAIGAGALYGVSLADADWLHGAGAL